MVDRIAADVDHQHPDASLAVETPDSLLVPAMPSLETALREVLENAAEHAGETPTITVVLEESGSGAAIQVTDDRPLPWTMTMDSTSITEDIGYRPDYSLEAGIEAYIDAIIGE
jgi:nucleoside-diphosphate-sugar epimerase